MSHFSHYPTVHVPNWTFQTWLVGHPYVAHNLGALSLPVDTRRCKRITASVFYFTTYQLQTADDIDISLIWGNTNHVMQAKCIDIAIKKCQVSFILQTKSILLHYLWNLNSKNIWISLCQYRNLVCKGSQRLTNHSSLWLKVTIF